MYLKLKKYQDLLLQDLVTTKRYLYNEISKEAKMIGIVGLRGVGKTTLLLQKLKEDKNKSIYFSMDNPMVFSVGLFEIVSKLYFDYGVRSFYIDEIHKYKNWNRDLKNIYDSFPKIKVIFSGSSSIDILKGTYDLSRRILVYKLNTLSFREFLELKYNKIFEKIALEDIFENTNKLEKLLLELYKIPILQDFYDYLHFGEFPFFREGTNKDYILKLENLINKIIYEDISSFYNLKTENLVYLKEILYFILNSEPGLFSANSISKNLKITNDSVNNYVNILKEVGLLNIIQAYGNISQSLRKAKKVFISILNINFLESFYNENINNVGRIRESFVIANFLNLNKNIFYLDKNGDFVFKLKENIVIEVGGKNKTKKQIKNIDNSFIISDNITEIKENKIPLFLFGFLY